MLVEPSISSLEASLTKAKTRRDDAVKRLGLIEAQVQRLVAEEELADLSAALIRTLIDKEVLEGVRAVEELLTKGLQAVFEDQDLSVRADVDVSYGKVSVDFVTVQHQGNGVTTEGLALEAYGGAVTTVQSVLLRLIVSMRRGLRPVLFLDETLPAFDANYVTNMGSFLRTMCKELGYDILLVSHNPSMVEAAQHAFKIVKEDGRAIFKRIR
jgi:DNA repair exonuclease SbcCD ATPase subunit